MKGIIMNLEKLKEEMPFKWRVQSQSDYGAQCVAYVDSRQVQDKLDDVVGPGNWQCDYKVINDNLYAAVAVKVDNEWVWKWDCGTESNTEKEKGEASDAFKRAAVKWGVGRFLYAMPLQKVKVKKHTNGKNYPCDDSGNILWDGDLLTEFVNKKINAGSSKQNPAKYEKPAEAPTYSNPTKSNWSKAVQDKAGKVDKGGLKGSQALLKYLPEYNKANETRYKTIQELDTDEKLTKLIEFVESFPPEGLI
jgi:hypothetical protein